MLLRRLFTTLIVTISFVDVVSAKRRSGGRIWSSGGSNSDGSSSTSTSGLGIIVMLIWPGICICSYCYRRRLRQRAEARFIRIVQTAVAQSQQPRSVYIIADRSIAGEPLTNEHPPPSYEQIQKQTLIKQSFCSSNLNVKDKRTNDALVVTQV